MWLDTPMIDIIHGEGTIEKRIPAMLRMFGKYGLDIRKQPILVYPTLHYQNGGVDISANAESMAGGAPRKWKSVKAMQKAGCESEEVSPRLLPDYRRKDM